MKSIIVEGPDGAGKSTLVQHLSSALGLNVHPRASDSKTGPIDQLSDWVETHITWLRQSGEATICDRHPVISEPIYGPLVRGECRKMFDDEGWLRHARESLRETTVVVWCMPSMDVVSANVAATFRDQMPGVLSHIRQVHQAYAREYFRWRGVKRVYDYPNNDYNCLTDELKRMIQQ